MTKITRQNTQHKVLNRVTKFLIKRKKERERFIYTIFIYIMDINIHVFIYQLHFCKET